MCRATRFAWAGLALCAAIFCAGPAPTASKPAIKTDSWYKWAGRGDSVGHFHLVRKASGVELAPVLFINEFEVKWKGKKLALKLQTLCKDDAYFTPVKITSEGEGDDEFGTFVATIDWLKTDAGVTGTLKATVRGKERKIELPAQTVPMFALFEVVRQLPLDKEKVFEFNGLEEPELNLKKDHKLKCVGEEEIHVGDDIVKAHRFDHSAGDRIVTQFWVSDKHELLRVLMDESKEYLLTTEEEARKALK